MRCKSRLNKSFLPLWISLTLILNEPIRLNAAEQTSCITQALQEMIADQPIRIIEDSSIRGSSRTVRIKDLFGGQPQVLLGIQTNGHAYLIVGDTRYDGEFLSSRGRVRTQVSTLSDGTIIRFKNLSPATIEALRQQLISKKDEMIWSSSCYSSACKQLEKGGIQLGKGNMVLPTTFFKSILTHGFVDSSEKPIPIEIYRTQTASIQKIYRNLRIVQTKKILAMNLIVAIVGEYFYLFFVKKST